MKPSFPLVLGASLLVAGLAVLHAPASAAAKHETLGKAAEFNLKSATDGKAVKLSSYKGKVRIVDFWATWCPPCRAEIPDFVALRKAYAAKGVEVIGLSVDREGPGVVSKFMKDNHINYPVAMATDDITTAYGGIRGIPTTFVIDRDGNIVKRYVGGTPKEQFEKDIKALL